jgi:hypothetical protein
MRASRTDDSRKLMFHSEDLRFDGRKALRGHIVRFVRGIRGERENPVTERQIVQWFQGTDAAFVRSVLADMVATGELRVCQRSLGSGRLANGAYVYELEEDKPKP